MSPHSPHVASNVRASIASLLIALVGGCSTAEPARPMQSAGGQAPTGGSSGAPGAATTSGGTNLGGAGAAAGGAGAGGTGVGGTGTSGNTGAGSAGLASGGDSGGQGAGPLAAAAALDGVRWELTCGATVEDGRVCEYANPCDAGKAVSLDKTVTFGGTAGKLYDVTLRFRGVVEPRKYLGGTADGAHFRIGGEPDPASDTNLYGVYSFEVSAPPQIFYLNDDAQTGHYVFPIDHIKTITISGGASIHLLGVDRVPPCFAARNCDPKQPVCTPFVVDGIEPAPAAFNGQFIQLNAVSVSEKPESQQ